MMGIMFLYLLFLITMGYGFLYFKITLIYLEYINYRKDVKLVLYKINDRFDIFDKKTLTIMDLETMNNVLDNLEITYFDSSDDEANFSSESVEEANESVEEANESVEEANESDEEANESVEEANESVEEANESVEEANESDEEANESDEEANESDEEANESSEEDEEIYTQVL